MKNKIFSLALLFTGIANGVPVMASPQVTPVVSQVSVLSAQAELARDYTLSKGRKNFLILDKKQAEIIAFENGQEAFRSKVFLGHLMGDDPVPELGATPAGVFDVSVEPLLLDKKAKKTPFTREGSVIPFFCEKRGPRLDICYLIHPTLQSPAEKRALAANTPEARRISHGCLRAVEYPKISAFIKRYETDIDEAPIFIVLPYDVSKTRQYLNISASFKVGNLPLSNAPSP